jgi:hypothetical protein
MTRFRLLIGAALIVSGVAPMALAAVPASNTVTVLASQTKTATARCRSGKLELGGFHTTTNGRVGVIVSALKPTSAAWEADATNLSANPGKLTSTAYCGREPRLQRVVGQTAVPAFAQGSVTATCPTGTSVRLGGFSASMAATNSGPQVIVDAFKRVSTRRWQVSAANGGGAPGSLTAIAECGKGGRLSTVARRTKVTSSGSSVSARCPAGLHVVMGGFLDAPISAAGPFINGLAAASGGRAWKASAFSPNSTGHLTAIAYCG